MPFPSIQKNTFKFSDFKKDQQEVLSIKITENLIKEFADLTGDKNPIHMSEDYAKKSIFKSRVAHGFLISSFFTSIYANLLPGEGSVLLEQDFQFLEPVFINEEVKYNVRIVSFNKLKRTIQLDLSCETSGKKVLEGKATILFFGPF